MMVIQTFDDQDDNLLQSKQGPFISLRIKGKNHISMPSFCDVHYFITCSRRAGRQEHTY